jgi:signal peptidase I
MVENSNLNNDDDFELMYVRVDVNNDKEKQSFNNFKKMNRRRKFVKNLYIYLIIIISAVALAFIINRFVIINAHVPTESMDPTINVNDKLIGFRLAYLFKDPQRGDIVIFKYPDDESQIFIKRIIGVPGDKVEIVEGVLYLNDKPTYEQYIKEKMYGNYGPYEVPEDCYFVLGDNRNISEDARFWKNTYVKKSQILAKAWFKYSPGFSSIK